MLRIMDMAQIERARALERTYDRRAARARRSKWLGRLLFSLTGMGLLLAVRMNPEIVGEAISWANGTGETRRPPTLSTPAEVHLRQMPGDVVPVRRGGALPDGGARAVPADAQSQADEVGKRLRGLNPGG